MLAASLGILERAQVPPVQARAIMEVIDLELNAQHDVVATKQDLGVLGSELRRDMQLLKHEIELKIEREIAKVRVDLVRWVFVCVLGQSAMLLGAAYFFVGHLVK